MTTRPTKRGDCVDGPRPCPFTQCRYHLQPTRRGETCALDAADQGRHSSREVGRMMELSRQQTSRIETEALHKMVRYFEEEAMDLVEDFTEWIET